MTEITNTTLGIALNRLKAGLMQECKANDLPITDLAIRPSISYWVMSKSVVPIDLYITVVETSHNHYNFRYPQIWCGGDFDGSKVMDVLRDGRYKDR